MRAFQTGLEYVTFSSSSQRADAERHNQHARLARLSSQLMGACADGPLADARHGGWRPARQRVDRRVRRHVPAEALAALVALNHLAVVRGERDACQLVESLVLVVGRGDGTDGEIELETVWIWACRYRLSPLTRSIISARSLETRPTAAGSQGARMMNWAEDQRAHT